MEWSCPSFYVILLRQLDVSQTALNRRSLEPQHNSDRCCPYAFQTSYGVGRTDVESIVLASAELKRSPIGDAEVSLGSNT